MGEEERVWVTWEGSYWEWRTVRGWIGRSERQKGCKGVEREEGMGRSERQEDCKGVNGEE